MVIWNNYRTELHIFLWIKWFEDSWLGFGWGYFGVGKEGCGDTPRFYCCVGIIYLGVVDYCVGLHLLIATAKIYVMSLI